ncbi:MAG: HEPN domain-containing protein [Methanosarcinales archaeon]
MESKLITLTPEKWGLLEELGSANALDLDKVKSMVQEIADKRMKFAEQYLNIAKMLLDNDLHYQSVISRAYYGMYHAARAAVYVQMRLDVLTHKDLIKKFRKVLINVYGDDTLGDWMNDWRTNRNRCDYNPFEEPTKEICNQAIRDCETIIETCKNLIVVI